MHPLASKPKKGESYVNLINRALGGASVGWRRLGLLSLAPVAPVDEDGPES